MQSPNFYGVVEDWTRRLAPPRRAAGALSVAVVAEAASLALLAPPGEGGADIACGEAQSLGVPMHNGGPLLGFLACRTEHQRQIPGRLVGQTRDAEGRRAFCLTLSTREQHIRREKATSNICTNQGLMALASNIHMSLLGKEGPARGRAAVPREGGVPEGRDREDPGLPDSRSRARPSTSSWSRRRRTPRALLARLAARKILGRHPAVALRRARTAAASSSR